MIGRLILGAALAALVLAGGDVALAQQRVVLPSKYESLAALGNARPPFAWVEFCNKYKSECQVDTREPVEIKLTPEIWRLIISVNNKVNRDIEPITDKDHWGAVDRWDMAEDGRGDCEEYVHVKRKRLADAGLPRRAMLNTVVIDDENAGLAVLMIRTDRGDFILDNKRNAILTWQQTGYIYIKRESQDKVEWQSLGGVVGRLAPTRVLSDKTK